MKRTLSPLCALLLAGACALACHPMENYQTEKFKLAASPAAADGYPAEIYRGNFLRSDGKSFPVPSGNFLTSGWGGSGTDAVVGEALQPAPDSLEILWFSYAEDKFYEGHFRLPQQRIHALLREGYWDQETKKQLTYSDLTVCVLPTGGVVVWLVGRNQVLIGRFQAQETAFNFRRFNSVANRALMFAQEKAKLPPAVQQQIAAGTLSAKKWDDYLTTYPWQLAFNLPVTLYDYSIDYLNSEGTDYPRTPDMAAYAQALLAPGPKPVPRRFSLFVQTEHGDRHQVRVKPFDEAETMAAFQALHRLSPASPITLQVELSTDFKKGSLVLKNEARAIPLRKTPVLLFDED